MKEERREGKEQREKEEVKREGEGRRRKELIVCQSSFTINHLT